MGAVVAGLPPPPLWVGTRVGRRVGVFVGGVVAVGARLGVEVGLGLGVKVDEAVGVSVGGMGVNVEVGSGVFEGSGVAVGSGVGDWQPTEMIVRMIRIVKEVIRLIGSTPLRLNYERYSRSTHRRPRTLIACREHTTG